MSRVESEFMLRKHENRYPQRQHKIWDALKGPKSVEVENWVGNLMTTSSDLASSKRGFAFGSTSPHTQPKGELRILSETCTAHTEQIHVYLKYLFLVGLKLSPSLWCCFHSIHSSMRRFLSLFATPFDIPPSLTWPVVLDECLSSLLGPRPMRPVH